MAVYVAAIVIGGIGVVFERESLASPDLLAAPVQLF
jgi:hypothetical protein